MFTNLLTETDIFQVQQMVSFIIFYSMMTNSGKLETKEKEVLEY